MGSDWNIEKIGKYVKVQGGFAFKSKDFTEFGLPVIKIKNVRKRDIDLTDVARVSESIAQESAKFLVKHGNVLISMTGSGYNAPASIVGRVARHNGKDDEFLINQRVGRFIVNDESKLNERFLYYIFSQEQMQYDLLSIATGSANQVNISAKQIEDIEIKLPPFREQKAIAHILGSLDDKIELNRRMNETLEAMAEALFKSWFVDFDPVIDNALRAGNSIPDVLQQRAEQRKQILAENSNTTPTADTSDINALFPSEFEFNDEMGWIPKEWEVETLQDLAEISSSKRIFAKEYQTEGVPFYRGKEISLLSKGRAVISEIYISRDRYTEIKEKFGVPKSGDILLTSVGTIGNAYLVNDNDEFYFKDGNLTWFTNFKTNIKGEYIYIWLKSRQAHLAINDITIGSTQQALTISSLNSIKLLRPNLEAVDLFNKNLKAMNNKSNALNQDIDILTKLRDTLLPKLMSGELRISDAEQLIQPLVKDI